MGILSQPDQGRMQGGGARGSSPKWLHDFQSTINNIIVSGEAILSAVDSGKLWAVRASSRTPLGDLTALPQTT